jgi:hypothetical protein
MWGYHGGATLRWTSRREIAVIAGPSYWPSTPHFQVIQTPVEGSREPP